MSIDDVMVSPIPSDRARRTCTSHTTQDKQRAELNST